MDTTSIKGLAVTGATLVALATAGVGGYKALSKPTFADVVAVREITETITTPREECKDVVVQQQAPVKDSNRIAGTVIGGVAGGVLGNQFGRGKGKTVATVAGAAGGAYVGNQAQKSMQKNDVVATTRRECTTVYDKTEKVVGYDVTYRLDGRESVVRTTFRPGPTLPVKDGQVDVTPPATAK